MSVTSFFANMFGKTAPKVVQRFLASPDPYPDYEHRFYDLEELLIEEIPIFRLWHARMMRRDPVIRIGLQTRNAALSAAEIEVESDNEQVKEYVTKLHKKMWGTFGTIVRRTKHYGFQALLVEYAKSTMDDLKYPVNIKTFSPFDVKPLSYRAKPVGFTIGSGIYGGSGKNIPVLPPRGLWLTYNTETNEYYGESILRNSYGPWYEKWMRRGAKRVTQQRYIKDAYIGDVLWYPPFMKVTMADGKEYPVKDFVREVGENRSAGNALYLPSLFDENGNKLIDYSKPSDTGNPTGIQNWMESLNVDMWRGMDVFEEVIRASEGGSGFSGRSVPFLMFLSSCNDEHIDLVCNLDQMMYRPLVWLQFGPDADYELNPIPLAETFVEDIAGSSIAGQSMGGAHGDRQFPEFEGDRIGMGNTKAKNEKKETSKPKGKLNRVKVDNGRQ